MPSDLSGLTLWLDAELSPKWQDSARTTPVGSDSDPVGSWDDRSGNGLHFAAPSDAARPTWKAGDPRHLLFDGTDDGLSKADAIFDLSDVSEKPFTLLAWVRLDSAPAVGNSLFSVGTSDFNVVSFYVSSNRRPWLVATTTSGTINQTLTAQLTLEQWAMVGFRRSVSGVYEASLNASWGTLTTNANDLVIDSPAALIGRHHAGSAGWAWTGAIGMVTLYGRALSNNEVIALYQSTGPNA